ncbi:MAG: membrane protein insertion efficiency factor YidD [Rhodospirillaceae bacterium]
MSVATHLLRGLVLAYRWLISPVLGPRCRFLPTCSDYALAALGRHGALAGGWLTLKRLSRCHPWGGSGYDPVPPLAAPPRPIFAPSGVHTVPTVPGTPEEP